MVRLKQTPFPMLVYVMCVVVFASNTFAQTLTPVEQPFVYGGLAWSSDGSQIAVGTSDGVWVHDADDLDNRRHAIKANCVTAMDWHPTEDWIVTGHCAGYQATDPLRIWDSGTGQVLHTLEGHDNLIGNVQWSPDGELLATRSWDRTVRVWDGASGELLRIISLQMIIDSFPSPMDWGPDSQHLTAAEIAQPDGISLFIYDVTSGTILQTWTASSGVYAMAWSPDGRQIATTGDSLSPLQIWSASSNELLGTVER